MQIRMYGSTDVGRVRKNNQDDLYFNASQGMVIVADGIGGRKGGEVASALAVEGMRKAFLECESLRHEEITPFLASSVDKVNQSILAKGRSDLQVAGLGTTMNCLLFVGDKIYIAHLGDSRTYLYYKGNLWQLTLDHSVEVYVGRGWLPQEAITNGGRPTALVRSLGLSEQCEVDIYEKTIRPGEVYITCSDGLTGMVKDKKIASVIRDNSHRLDAVPRLLVAEANRKGGRDNITVVISAVVAD